MRTITKAIFIASVLALGQGVATAKVQEGRQGKTSIRASVPEAVYVLGDDLKWVDAPPVLPAGAKMAVLDGDPSLPNRLFSMRLMLPAGYRVMPHWHPADEHVTVVSGEFQIGEGDTFNAESAKALGPGGYFVMPAKHHHYAAATKDTVIQIHGVGAWKLIYVNPADDPSKKK